MDPPLTPVTPDVDTSPPPPRVVVSVAGGGLTELELDPTDATQLVVIVTRAVRRGTSRALLLRRSSSGLTRKMSRKLSKRAAQLEQAPMDMTWMYPDGETFDPHDPADYAALYVFAQTHEQQRGEVLTITVANAAMNVEDHAALALDHQSSGGMQEDELLNTFIDTQPRPQGDPASADSSGNKDSPATDGAANGVTDGGGADGVAGLGDHGSTGPVSTLSSSMSSSVSFDWTRKWLVRPPDGIDPDTKKPRSECLYCFPDGHWLPARLEMLSMVVILVSVVSFVLETLPRYRLDENGEERDDDHPTFFAIESACIAWFTIEYIMRWFSAHDRKRFPYQAMNIVDLIAILPYYIGLMLGGSGASSIAIIRILRLARVSRLFKMSRHFQGLADMIGSIANSGKELALFAVIGVVGSILFGSLIFYGDDQDNFISIPGGMWWGVISMTTVGYGDFFPVTTLGYFIGYFVISFGVVMLAIPAGVFISEFMRQNEAKKKVTEGKLPPSELCLSQLEWMIKDGLRYVQSERLRRARDKLEQLQPGDLEQDLASLASSLPVTPAAQRANALVVNPSLTLPAERVDSDGSNSTTSSQRRERQRKPLPSQRPIVWYHADEVLRFRRTGAFPTRQVVGDFSVSTV